MRRTGTRILSGCFVTADVPLWEIIFTAKGACYKSIRKCEPNDDGPIYLDETKTDREDLSAYACGWSGGVVSACDMGNALV